MTLYIIIVTYNAEKWIDKFMASINNSTVKCKVIVIDNASQDATIDIIKSKHPDVDLIENHENLGFGAANNLGIKKALEEGADYVFLLNQDAWVEDDTFEKLIGIASSHPEYGILSPLQMKNNNYERLFIDMITMGKYKYQLISDLMNNTIHDCYPVEFVQAAGWFITRQCLTKVGLFDPLFYHYGEDTDYARRVWRHNLKIGIATKAKMTHLNEPSCPSNKTKKLLYKKDLNLAYSNRANWLKDYPGNFAIGFLKYSIDTLALCLKDFIHIRNSIIQIHLWWKNLFSIKKYLYSRKHLY